MTVTHGGCHTQHGEQDGEDKGEDGEGGHKLSLPSLCFLPALLVVLLINLLKYLLQSQTSRYSSSGGWETARSRSVKVTRDSNNKLESSLE